MKTQVLKVLIKRDAMSSTSKEIPAYELPILSFVHKGAVDVLAIVVDDENRIESDEYIRLAKCYGDQECERVYGLRVYGLPRPGVLKAFATYTPEEMIDEDFEGDESDAPVKASPTARKRGGAAALKAAALPDDEGGD